MTREGAVIGFYDLFYLKGTTKKLVEGHSSQIHGYLAM